MNKSPVPVRPRGLSTGVNVPGEGTALFSQPTLELLLSARRVAREEGLHAYVVGGAVRDALLGRPQGDVDLAVEGDVARLAHRLGAALGAAVVPLDPERRVYRLALASGRGSVDLCPIAGGLAEDLLRRDFTIDALALRLDDLSAGPLAPSVTDLAGGLEDLRRRVLRAVTPGVFAEDPARLLRAVRLAAELGFSIEPETLALLRLNARLLSGVAAERVRDELCRILAAPEAGAHLRLLDELGLLTAIFPELEAGRGCAQPKEHYWNVLQHSIETAGAVERVLRQTPDQPPVPCLPWDGELEARFHEDVGGGRSRATALKLAALLHDVAKPATKTIEPGGRIRFFGHPKLGAEMAEGAMRRLRFSNRETRLVAAMVQEHLRPGLITRGDDAPTSRAVHRYFRDAGEAAVDTIFLSFADYLAARGPLLEQGEWARYAGSISAMLETWRERQRHVSAPKLLDGHDLMREMGLPPGPALSPLLEAVREAQAAGEIATREQGLALARSLSKQAHNSKGKG